MIAYTTIGTADIEKAKAFYLALLHDMNATIVMDILPETVSPKPIMNIGCLTKVLRLFFLILVVTYI